MLSVFFLNIAMGGYEEGAYVYVVLAGDICNPVSALEDHELPKDVDNDMLQEWDHSGNVSRVQ